MRARGRRQCDWLVIDQLVDAFILRCFFIGWSIDYSWSVDSWLIFWCILKGFLIDLFFSNISTPYTFIYMLMGLYLNFSNLRWIQRSLLEQIILIISVSLSLNILLFAFNSFSDDMMIRIILNPLLNSIIWAIIFLNQKQKWLKNI